MDNFKEQRVDEREQNPILTANFLSKWSFWWTLKFFRKGYSRPLKEEDIYQHKESFDTAKLTEKFTELWKDELKRKNPSIVRLIIRAYGSYFLPLCIGFAILETAAKTIQPYCLGNLVSYFSQNDNTLTKQNAYFYASGLVLTLLPPVIFFHPLMFYVLEIGLRVRLGLSGIVYNKILKISTPAATAGLSAKAINVLSNDVGKFDYVFSFIHDTLVGPMQLIALTYLAYIEMGVSSFFGILFLILFIPCEAWGAKLAAKFHQRTSKLTDYRVKLMNEVIQGIQLIKMYAWEKSFAKILGNARHNEIRAIRGTSSIYAFLQTTSIISKFAVFITILTYIQTGDVITARKVFTISSIYDVLNRSLIYFWPTAITYMAQANISANRILEVLLEHENCDIPKAAKETLMLQNDKKNGIFVKFENVSAIWNLKPIDSLANASTALSSISLNIDDGNFVAVIGPVGSGKSTFLNCILGELQILNGEVLVEGKLSYASQESWIFENTIRENIIFTEPFDSDRYNKVLQVCALEEDLKHLSDGDLTRVGERGISLSGGQKARLNLARAVYRKADIYLLDDPLSAVDAHVAKHIFEQCFLDFLKNKVRVLVTHQIQYLKDIENIVLINHGHLEYQGNYENLHEMEQFHYLTQHYETKVGEKNVKTPIKKLGLESGKHHKGNVQREEKVNLNENRKEKQEVGSVKFQVFFSYFKALKSWLWFILVAILFLIARAVLAGVDYFISRWVIVEEDRDITGESLHSIRVQMIAIYSCLLGAALVLYILRSFGFFLMCLRISLKLHDKMFTGITRATMYFFDMNPSGRILNRFSKDMNTIDTTLPMTLIDCIFFVTDITATIVMVSIANYWLLIPAFLMAILFYFIRNFYINTSRSVKRMESASRSPIYSHINQTFQGLTTIRAVQAESSMEKDFHNYQNLNASCWFLFLATTRAFVLWLDFLCVIYIALVTYSFIVLQDQFYSGDVGLAITQSISLITMCQWGLRQTAELEIQMTSVERILEYANVKSEPALESIPENRPSEKWPSEGKIMFKDFKLKYSPDGEYILKNLNFEIKPQEKIGIVGRTGAGKSSIIQSIFRLACNEGYIKIDDVDIDKLGLHDLRTKISIIPQDPVLFSGTLRHNLDPFEKSTDEELWMALEEVELKEYVSSMAEGLSSKMSDGGSNFSMGQRQLVCLARAILRKNKILILDEATANVDPETDILIQQTIRKKFKSCTVLTIAHRLHTVMDSDRIIVIDAGELVEYDHPFELLKKTDGYFQSLVNETEPDNCKFLYEIAQKSFETKYGGSL